MPKPKLNSDVTLKAAVAGMLRRNWIPPEHPDGLGERLPLREMRVSCTKEVVQSLSSLLPKGDPAGQKDTHGNDLNLLLSEIVVFCPIGRPGWQFHAEIVLKEHVAHYRRELARIREELRQPVQGPRPGSVSMYAVPFGRFLLPDETPRDWVSDVKTISLPLEALFENCEDAGLKPKDTAEIHYFTRPYIVWPVKPGTLNHWTHCHEKDREISRKDLSDPRLQLSVGAIASAPSPTYGKAGARRSFLDRWLRRPQNSIR